jgi:hypothetical protein
MKSRIVSASYVRDYVVHLRFADGSEGDVDLREELEGEIFEPLKNKQYFAGFSLHPELHTLIWPNGADFAPEFLLKLIQVRA